MGRRVGRRGDTSPGGLPIRGGGVPAVAKPGVPVRMATSLARRDMTAGLAVSPTRGRTPQTPTIGIVRWVKRRSGPSLPQPAPIARAFLPGSFRTRSRRRNRAARQASAAPRVDAKDTVETPVGHRKRPHSTRVETMSDRSHRTAPGPFAAKRPAPTPAVSDVRHVATAPTCPRTVSGSLRCCCRIMNAPSERRGTASSVTRRLQGRARRRGVCDPAGDRRPTRPCGPRCSTGQPTTRRSGPAPRTAPPTCGGALSPLRSAGRSCGGNRRSSRSTAASSAERVARSAGAAVAAACRAFLRAVFVGAAGMAVADAPGTAARAPAQATWLSE
jgi:hypothetical protein